MCDDARLALAASKDTGNAGEPLRVGESDGDSDMSHEKADRELTESAERLRLVRPQK